MGREGAAESAGGAEPHPSGRGTWPAVASPHEQTLPVLATEVRAQCGFRTPRSRDCRGSPPRLRTLPTTLHQKRFSGTAQASRSSSPSGRRGAIRHTGASTLNPSSTSPNPGPAIRPLRTPPSVVPPEQGAGLHSASPIRNLLLGSEATSRFASTPQDAGFSMIQVAALSRTPVCALRSPPPSRRRPRFVHRIPRAQAGAPSPRPLRGESSGPGWWPGEPRGHPDPTGGVPAPASPSRKR